MPSNYYLQVKLSDHWYNYAFSDKLEPICLELIKQVKLFHKAGKLCPPIKITLEDTVLVTLF